MTASSLGVFPCRVQLIGLPQSVTNSAPRENNDTTTTTQANHDISTYRSQTSVQSAMSTTTPITKLNSKNRNLFGTPDRREMNQLYQKEMQRQRSYLMQRYNFDVDTFKFIDSKKPQQKQLKPVSLQYQCRPTEKVATKNLIEQELQQHEERLKKEKCDLTRTIAGTTVLKNQLIKPTNYNNSVKSITNCHNKNNSDVIYCTCCKGAPSIRTQPIDSIRFKPYKGQMTITDCFSLRKNECRMIDNHKTTTLTNMKTNTQALSQQSSEILRATNTTDTSFVQKSLSKSSDCINMVNNEKNNNNVITQNDDNQNNNYNDSVIDVYKNTCIARSKDGLHNCHHKSITVVPGTLLNGFTTTLMPKFTMAEWILKISERKLMLNENDCSKSNIEIPPYASNQTLK